MKPACGFTDNHEPEHVHVFGDGTAKINLASETGAPKLVHVDGIKAGDLRKAMRIVAAEQVYLIERWRKFHG